jgi:hypothetical protein
VVCCESFLTLEKDISASSGRFGSGGVADREHITSLLYNNVPRQLMNALNNRVLEHLQPRVKATEKMN